MSKLLPCPFCGNEASSYDSPPRGLVAECMNSDCCLYDANEGHGISAAQWNTRHTPDGWQCVPKRMDRAMMSAAIPNDQCNFPDYRAQEYEMQARYIRALSAAPSPNDTPSHTAETTDNQESDK